MSEAHSLQALIIENAGELFRERGYAATTIKQIAEASGCTTAALYYHFEDGKQHILREVIHSSTQEADLSMHLPQADSLEEFLVKLGANMAERFPKVADRINWIMLAVCHPTRRREADRPEPGDRHPTRAQRTDQPVRGRQSNGRAVGLVGIFLLSRLPADVHQAGDRGDSGPEYRRVWWLYGPSHTPGPVSSSLFGYALCLASCPFREMEIVR